MKNYDLTKTELKILLKKENVKIRPSYCHDKYILTSITMPYPVKRKLDTVTKKLGVSRSGFVAMLIENYEE